MRTTIAVFLSLLIAANGAQAAVGFRVENLKQVAQDGRTTRVLRYCEWQDEQLRLFQLSQAVQGQTEGRVYTMADGYIAGRLAAENRDTAGSFVGGLAVGFLTGLIGTGILWGLTDGDDVPHYLMSSYQGKGLDYSVRFMSGYKERTKQKKRGARLGGGLLGTIAFLVLYHSAN